MSGAIVTLAGVVAVAARVHVPPGGPWFADVDLDTDASLPAGKVDLVLGPLTVRGTVAAPYAGTYAAQRRVRVIAGAGGWGTLVTPRAYHNDGGVRPRTVADDAARIAGETLGDFAPGADPLPGADYVRGAGPASSVLEDVIGDAAWWVDYDGTTRVGARSTSDPVPRSYEVLDYNPRTRTAVLTVDDPGAVVIGSRLRDPTLPDPQTVHELTIEVTHAAIRLHAWTGGTGGRYGRAAGALRALIAAAGPSEVPIYGARRYRVSSVSGDRLMLQAVNRTAGLPDVGPISAWPGVAGAHAVPAVGAEVLVEFIEGDRAQPYVTAWAGRDGHGFVPVSLLLDIETTLTLGAAASEFVALAASTKARLDTIQSTFDAHTHPYIAGTGSPITGAPTPTPIGPLGPIAATKVKAE
jgi:hypothetical protein